MDKKTPSEKKRSLSDTVKSVKDGVQKRKRTRGALICDAAVLVCAFLFARRHIAFGAYPLATALVATLPRRVFIAAVGAVVGSFSFGPVGFVNALAAVMTVFLRIIIGSGKSEREDSVFAEPYVMRIAAGAIGSSVGGIYEIVASRFSFSSVIFASFGVLATVFIAFAFLGLFSTDVTYSDVMFGEKNLFFSPKDRKAKYELAMFCVSFLVFVFLLSFSLSEYSFFGVSLAYVFTGVLTLFVAKRFGGVRSGVCAFVSALPVSALGAVGFAACGFLAGFVFPYGYLYALIAGGAALLAWSSYTEGLIGFLSVMPEFSVACAIISPYLRTAKREREDDNAETEKISPYTVVDTAHTRYTLNSAHNDMQEPLARLAAAVGEFVNSVDVSESFSDYRDMIIALTAGLAPVPCEENIDAIAHKLCNGAHPDKSEADRILGVKTSESLYESIIRRAGELSKDRYESRERKALSFEYDFISKLLHWSDINGAAECECDVVNTAKLNKALHAMGLDGCVKVLGERRKRVFFAAEQREEIMSSDRVKDTISRTLGFPLEDFRYYKKEGVLLVECGAAPTYRAEFATVSQASERTGICGDSALSLERCGTFYSLISDGEGSGERARRISRFVADYVSGVLSPAVADLRAFAKPLNAILRCGTAERAATLDLLSFDSYTGEASFVKCAAAPSFIRREDSIYRIRARTAPLGVTAECIPEIINTGLCDGDIVVMISDGVDTVPDECAWLIEFISEPVRLDVREYAQKILSLSLENRKHDDDVTVSVIKILKNETTQAKTQI